MSRRRIVLIDDAEIDRFVFIQSLKVSGIEGEFEEFENPLDALAALNNTDPGTRPDLIVTDITMPEMNGYGVIKAIRETPHLQDVPIAVLTGFSPDNNEEMALSLGADLFLIKPITGLQIQELAILLSRKKR